MSSNLAADLRQDHAGPGRKPIRFRRERTVALPASVRIARAQALLSAVLAYRAGPTIVYGPVILDLLAPSIVFRLQRLKARPPVLDSDDLRQQFVLEVLRAAATMPIPGDPMHLRGALIARANEAMRRVLLREGWKRERQVSLDAIGERRRGR